MEHHKELYIALCFKIKPTKTHLFVPFHTMFFIALHGNGPEIQFTSAWLKNFTYHSLDKLSVSKHSLQYYHYTCIWHTSNVCIHNTTLQLELITL